MHDEELKSLRHLNEFITLKCAPTLLSKSVYPNAKEITESMGAYDAIRQIYKRQGDLDLYDESITAVFVGDGRSPRTGALFAAMTRWNCISIDPELDIHKWTRALADVKRLTLINKKIEHVPNIKGRTIVLVAVHSHADLNVAYHKMDGSLIYVVAIPCCVEQIIKNLGGYELSTHNSYVDMGIASPARTILTWSVIK